MAIKTKYLETKYNAALELHNSECQIQWNRFSAMLVANTILIGFMGFTYSKDFVFPLFIRLFLVASPILGIIICIWWYKVTMKGFAWIKFWIGQMNEIENIISDPSDKNDPKPIHAGDEFRSKHEPGLTKKATQWIIWIFIGIYSVSLFANLFNNFGMPLILLFTY